MRVLKSFGGSGRANALRALFFLCAVSVLCLFLAACSEEDDPSDDGNDPEYSPEVMALTAGEMKEWQIESLVKDGEPADLQACDEDNLYVFEADSGFAFQNGEERCADELAAFEGTWIFQNNGGFIFAEGASESKLFEVKQLTEQRLVLSFNTTEGEREETLIPARIP